MSQYLIDTNVLMRISGSQSAQFSEAARAIDHLADCGDVLFITPQNIVEFWAVVTRPVDANGFGWSVEETSEQAGEILSNFRLLEDTPEIFSIWMSLVRSHKVSGKQVHDARLVAVMKAHGVKRLLTFNVDDFKRYQEIEAINPASI